ncbi:MAG: hypothetical protein AAGA60_28495 [Cyanobacteria bacterium P01_E01_bin.42]
MNNKPESLWGEIPTSENLRTPYTILQEQASILSESTQGLLLGEVVPMPYTNRPYLSLSPNQRQFYGVLRIKVPSLTNYTYSLLEVEYPIQTYPIFVRNLAGEDDKYECEDEEGFKAAVKDILSSDEVRQVIAILLSQIQAEVS